METIVQMNAFQLVLRCKRITLVSQSVDYALKLVQTIHLRIQIIIDNVGHIAFRLDTPKTKLIPAKLIV